MRQDRAYVPPPEGRQARGGESRRQAFGGGSVIMAVIFNLNHPSNTVHWHFFSMSVANVVVIVVMLIVFAAAIVVPFPGHGAKEPTQ
jgi:hypothetical protein